MELLEKRLHRRLASLEAEFEKGKHLLVQMDEHREGLVDQMLRLSGAIQVLAEELGVRTSHVPFDLSGPAEDGAPDASSSAANPPAVAPVLPLADHG